MCLCFLFSCKLFFLLFQWVFEENRENVCFGNLIEVRDSNTFTKIIFIRALSYPGEGTLFSLEEKNRENSVGGKVD